MKTSPKNLLLSFSFLASVCVQAQNGSELALNTQAPASTPVKTDVKVNGTGEENLVVKKQKRINNNLRALAIARAEIRATEAAQAKVHGKEQAEKGNKAKDKPTIQEQPAKNPAAALKKPAPVKAKQVKAKTPVRKKFKASKTKGKKPASKKNSQAKGKKPVKAKGKE